MELGPICDAFGLGKPTSDPEAAAAGWGERNVVWRLETDRGAFAVKDCIAELLPDDPVDAFRIERLAHEKRVRCPAPIPARDGGSFVDVGDRWYRCHDWVSGSSKQNEDTTADDAYAMGELVASLHQLEISTARALPSNSFGRAHWLGLARSRPGADWSSALAAKIDLVLEAERHGSSVPSAPVISSHRDLNAHNVLFTTTGPMLIDWDAAGPTTAVFERSSTPVLWAQRPDGTLDVAIARAFLLGYRDAGGDIDSGDVNALPMSLSGLTWWTERNVQIAVAQPSDHHDQLAGWLVDALAAGVATVRARQQFMAEVIASL